MSEKNMKSGSPFDIGYLNNIVPKKSNTKMFDGRFGVNNIDLIKARAKTDITSNLMEGLTVFKAVVLKKLENPNTNSGDDASRNTSSRAAASSTQRDSSRKSLNKYYIRIPELHRDFPMPSSQDDMQKIRFHPVATMESPDKQSELPSIQPSDIVLVRFNDPKNLANLVVIGFYQKGILTSQKNDKCPPELYRFVSAQGEKALTNVSVLKTHSGTIKLAPRARLFTKKVMIIGGAAMRGELGKVLQKQYLSRGYGLINQKGQMTTHGVQTESDYRIAKTGSTLRQMILDPVDRWAKQLQKNIIETKPSIVVFQFDEIFQNSKDGDVDYAVSLIADVISKISSLTSLEQLYIVGTTNRRMVGPWPKYKAVGTQDEFGSTIHTAVTPNKPWIDKVKSTLSLNNKSSYAYFDDKVVFVDPLETSAKRNSREAAIIIWNKYFLDNTPAILELPPEVEIVDRTDQTGADFESSDADLIPPSIKNSTREEATKWIKRRSKRLEISFNDFVSRNFRLKKDSYTFIEWAKGRPDVKLSAKTDINDVESQKKYNRRAYKKYVKKSPIANELAATYIDIYNKKDPENIKTDDKKLKTQVQKCLQLLKDSLDPDYIPPAQETKPSVKIDINLGTKKDYPNPGWSMPIEKNTDITMSKYDNLNSIFNPDRSDGIAHKVILQAVRLEEFHKYENGRKKENFSVNDEKWQMVMSNLDAVNLNMWNKSCNYRLKGKMAEIQMAQIKYCRDNGIPVIGWGYASPYIGRVLKTEGYNTKLAKNLYQTVKNKAANLVKVIKQFQLETICLNAEQCWVHGHDPYGSMIVFVQEIRSKVPDVKIMLQGYVNYGRLATPNMNFVPKYLESKQTDKLKKKQENIIEALVSAGRLDENEAAKYKSWNNFVELINTQPDLFKGWHHECDKTIFARNKEEDKLMKKALLSREFLQLFEAVSPMCYGNTPFQNAKRIISYSKIFNKAGGIPYIPTQTTGYWSADKAAGKFIGTAYFNDSGDPENWLSNSSYEQLKDRKDIIGGAGMLTMRANQSEYGPFYASQFYYGNGYYGSLTVGTEINPPFYLGAKAIREGKQGFIVPNFEAEGALKRQWTLKKGKNRIKKPQGDTQKFLKKELYTDVKEQTTAATGDVVQL